MFKLLISPDGSKTFSVVATSRDIAMWEKTTKGASLAQLNDDKRMTDIYKIAHFAVLRNGLWDGTLAEFMEQVDVDFEDDDEDEGSDPTQSAAS